MRYRWCQTRFAVVCIWMRPNTDRKVRSKANKVVPRGNKCRSPANLKHFPQRTTLAHKLVTYFCRRARKRLVGVTGVLRSEQRLFPEVRLRNGRIKEVKSSRRPPRVSFRESALPLRLYGGARGRGAVHDVTQVKSQASARVRKNGKPCLTTVSSNALLDDNDS